MTKNAGSERPIKPFMSARILLVCFTKGGRLALAGFARARYRYSERKEIEGFRAQDGRVRGNVQCQREEGKRRPIDTDCS